MIGYLPRERQDISLNQCGRQPFFLLCFLYWSYSCYFFFPPQKTNLGQHIVFSNNSIFIINADDKRAC